MKYLENNHFEIFPFVLVNDVQIEKDIKLVLDIVEKRRHGLGIVRKIVQCQEENILYKKYETRMAQRQ